MKPTSLPAFLTDLGGGVFAEKVERALSDVAARVVDYGDNGKSGSVTITLTMKRIDDASMVSIGHKLAYAYPTKYGKAGEEETQNTPMHVGPGGAMSFVPHDQGALEFDPDTGEIHDQ